MADKIGRFATAINLLLCIGFSSCVIEVRNQDLTLKLHEKDVVVVDIRNLETDTAIQLVVQHNDIIRLNKTILNLERQENYSIPIEVEAIGAGHSTAYANQSYSSVNVDKLYVRVTVFKINGLNTFSTVIGWVYFVAWSVSFYPQMYINWKRKSVVGLNFDFIALNILGFTLYSVFNLGLYSIPEIKEEYTSRYPRGLNPVKINDIFFAVHATAATLFTIFQCFIYERGEQTVSRVARGIIASFGVFLLISVIIATADVIHWLDFLYYCSYVKLTITLIKYVPQAYMNYRRKSTIGWSIGNIFLDFTGGTLSMLQMIVDSYNYDDWVSIFGDPTKFGLGLFSVAFDIFFIIQHYILYRRSSYVEPKC